MASTFKTQTGEIIKIPDIGEAFINEAERQSGIESVFVPTSTGLKRVNVRDYISGGYKNTVNINSQLKYPTHSYVRD